MPNGHMRQWLPREKSCVYYSVDDPDETEPLFNFGKYRGKSLKKVYSIPAGKGYIQWILRQSFEAKGGTLLDNKAFTQPCLIDPDLIEALEMVVNEETYEKVSYKRGSIEDPNDERRKYWHQIISDIANNPTLLKTVQERKIREAISKYGEELSGTAPETKPSRDERRKGLLLRREASREEGAKLGMTAKEYSDYKMDLIRQEAQFERFRIKEELDWS